MNLENYELGPVVAVIWNDTLAARFPGANHNNCLQSGHWDNNTGRWEPLEPPICHGWHCPSCGAPTGSMGHRTCPTTNKGD